LVSELRIEVPQSGELIVVEVGHSAERIPRPSPHRRQRLLPLATGTHA
jgi:hypothetical protein